MSLITSKIDHTVEAKETEVSIAIWVERYPPELSEKINKKLKESANEIAEIIKDQ